MQDDFFFAFYVIHTLQFFIIILLFFILFHRNIIKHIIIDSLRKDRFRFLIRSHRDYALPFEIIQIVFYDHQFRIFLFWIISMYSSCNSQISFIMRWLAILSKILSNLFGAGYIFLTNNYQKSKFDKVCPFFSVIFQKIAKVFTMPFFRSKSRLKSMEKFFKKFSFNDIINMVFFFRR